MAESGRILARESAVRTKTCRVSIGVLIADFSEGLILQLHIAMLKASAMKTDLTNLILIRFIVSNNNKITAIFLNLLQNHHFFMCKILQGSERPYYA
jgi:hypothetical protein